MICTPPRSPLFPYPTLFRSSDAEQDARQVGRVVEHHDRARPESCADGARALEAQRHVELFLSHERAGGATEKNRLEDRKSTRLNSSHSQISYAVFCLKKKKN